MVRRLVGGTVAVLLLAAAAAAIANRGAYGSFAWWRRPARISWCARRYLPTTGPTLTRAQVQQQRESLPGDSPYPMVTVTRVPPLVGRPVLASPVPGATRRRLGVPCAMAVYLQTAPDAFQSYHISGGP